MTSAVLVAGRPRLAGAAAGDAECRSGGERRGEETAKNSASKFRRLGAMICSCRTEAAVKV